MSGYPVIIEKDPDSDYGAWSPDLPGCVATGSTAEESLAAMREAILGHLAVLREYGDPVPPPSAVRVAIVETA